MKAVSGKEMCRTLKKRGWALSRISGSHHIFNNPDNPAAQVIVPVHGNQSLATGTQKSIMKTAGLTEDDL